MAKTFVLVCALAALASLGGAQGSPAGRAKAGGTFRVALTSGGVGISTIDPALEASVANALVLGPTCGSLVTFPDKPLPAGWKPTLGLASRYSVSPNRRAYTFVVRRDARFSNGAPVTARSFAHAMNRTLAPVMQSSLAGFLDDVVGAARVASGRARSASGIVAKGRRLVIHLTQPASDLLLRLTAFCAVPDGLPTDPEGANAPLASAGPYYVSSFTRGRQVVLTRNRYYRGPQAHHVDRFVVDLGNDLEGVLDKVETNQADWGWVPNAVYAERAAALGKRFGVNKGRFFIRQGLFLREFVLNTARPLFRGNVALRRAVNFAADRKALLRQRGAYAGFLTDQYLPPLMPGYENASIYPLRRPNRTAALRLARGHTRSGTAVLYTCTTPVCVSQAQILAGDIEPLGLTVQIKRFPGVQLFDRLATPGEPFDIGWVGWDPAFPDPGLLDCLFDGDQIGKPSGCNYSDFDSPRYDRLLRAANALRGAARYRAFGRLDAQIARDAAPAVPFAYDNTLTLVSNRVGCVVLTPELDLEAACLK